MVALVAQVQAAASVEAQPITREAEVAVTPWKAPDREPHTTVVQVESEAAERVAAQRPQLQAQQTRAAAVVVAVPIP